MLDGQPEPFAAGVHARKPAFDAGVKLHVPAERDEVLAPHRAPARVRALEHQVHVREDAVHLLGFGELFRLFPELGRLHADLRDEAVFLHVLGAQRLVEIVQQRRDGTFFGQYGHPRSQGRSEKAEDFAGAG